MVCRLHNASKPTAIFHQLFPTFYTVFGGALFNQITSNLWPRVTSHLLCYKGHNLCVVQVQRPSCSYFLRTTILNIGGNFIGCCCYALWGVLMETGYVGRNYVENWVDRLLSCETLYKALFPQRKMESSYIRGILIQLHFLNLDYPDCEMSGAEDRWMIALWY